MNKWFISVCMGFCAMVTNAQNPVADFSLPANACLHQNISIENQSVNANAYEWDFCQGDLALTPAASTLLNLGGSNGGNVIVGVDFIKENGLWYGFFCSLNTNEIFRLDFGEDINNPAPVVNNLGSLGGVVRAPQDIKIVKENDQFYAFISSRSGNRLTRLSFDENITNGPIADVILSGNAPVNTGLDVAFDGTSWVVALTNTNTITLVRMGNTLSNTIDPLTDVINTGVIPNTNVIGDISLIKEGNDWRGIIVSVNTKAVLRADFGGSLFVVPSVTDVTNSGISSLLTPYGIWCTFENGKYQSFISTIQGSLIRFDFGATLATNTPISNNLGTLGVLSNTLKLTGVRNESNYLIFTSNWSANNVLKINFPQATCNLSYDFTDLDNPLPIIASTSGDIFITLYAHSFSGLTSSGTKKINVSTLEAPGAGFDSNGVCAGNDVVFIPNESGLSYDWNFGGETSSTDENPVRQYENEGKYGVQLTVTAPNSCQNFKQDTIQIFSPPQANFNLPSSVPLCTNQEYLIENTSSVDLGYPVAWNWSVNSVDQSIDEDLEFSFDDVMTYEITLTATIPGCESVSSEIVNGLTQGPLVDFSSVGFCQDSQINFVNNTTGDITSYQWDFDDGDGSTDTNPNHAFQSPGIFDVTLQASSSNGCQNSKTKAITIYSKPQADFLLALPPFSCSGSASQFTDVTPNPTDSNLDFWQWDFDDPESGQNSSNDQNPQHIYENPGAYNVSLTVGTNFGCETTIQKPVTIAQSPTVTIVNSPACQDVPIEFLADSDVPIKNWSWQMGTTSYYFENPTHLFSVPASYDVFLDVVGTNDCVASVSKVIDIFQPLTPDFVVQKSCVDQQTEFTDVTLTNGDPVASVNWNFGDGNTGAGTPVLHTFATAGDRLVQLNVITEGGCVYSGSKNVSILPTPVASFTASPEVGIPPLTVQFTNTSSGATAYIWEFNDPANTTSTQPAPSFTFVDEGNHVVKLTVTNSQGCMSSTSKIIAVEIPVIDIAIETFVISEGQDGVLTGNVQLQNNGNVTISNLLLTINLSGIQIQSIVTEPIPANASIAHSLNFNIIQTNALGYICVRADLDGDRNTFDNEECVSSGDETFVFTPYPNPSTGTVMVGWIATESQPVTIKVYDPLGKLRLDNLYTSASGLTTANLNLEGMTSGVYLVVFDSGEVQQTFRIRLE